MKSTFIKKLKKKLYPYTGRPYKYLKEVVVPCLKSPDRRYGRAEIHIYAPARRPVSDLSERSGIVDEYLLLAEENDRKISSNTITDNYYNAELDENAILLVGLGKNIKGNMRYILDELNKAEEYQNFSMYVHTSDETDSVVKKVLQQNKWKRTHTVCKDRQYLRLLESVKYLITEVYFPEGWVKKPGQVYINIWHGTPLKKLGLSKNFRNHHTSGVVQKNFIEADYLLYPNEYTREKMLASYKVSQLISAKTFLLGYPRTGGMIALSQGGAEKARQRLAPNGERIYAYMPTFRDYLEMEESVALAKNLLDYLDTRLRSDQLLYVNLHHRLDDSIDYSVYSHIKKFPPKMDSYRLLSQTDALISDYSSVFIDYLALRKQIILYIPDLAEYRKRRGMYLNLTTLPFDKAYSCEEVLDAINRGKQYNDDEAFANFCSHDSPANAKLLCNLFRGVTEGLTLEDIPKNDRHRSLIFSGAMQAGYATEFLRKFNTWYDKNKGEIYFSCNMEKTGENLSSAYPMLFRAPVFGTTGILHLSSLGLAIRNLYLEEIISFEKAIEYLRYDYAVNLRRMYGRAAFDTVVIYDSDDPDTILSLAQSPASKIMFLQRGMIDRILSGDRFLRDAVRYVSGFCRAVLVMSSSDISDAEEILRDVWTQKIQTVVTIKQMSAAVFPETR